MANELRRLARAIPNIKILSLGGGVLFSVQREPQAIEINSIDELPAVEQQFYEVDTGDEFR